MLSTPSIAWLGASRLAINPPFELQNWRAAAATDAAINVLSLSARRRSGDPMRIRLHEILEPRSFTGLGVEWGP